MPTANWKFDQRIESDPNLCAKIIEQLLDELEDRGWNNKDTFGIHMAVEEAIMNAIHHGNQCGKDKNVHIELEVNGTTFRARITDQGCGFDPNDVPDPTAEENLAKSSGRGVMLIQHFVDSVKYNDVGNSVQLEKQKTEAS